LVSDIINNYIINLHKINNQCAWSRKEISGKTGHTKGLY
jgi:hypothetical protein